MAVENQKSISIHSDARYIHQDSMELLDDDKIALAGDQALSTYN